MRLFPPCLLLGLVPGLFGNPKICSGRNYRLQPAIVDYEHTGYLQTDGSYSACVSLNSRLPFVKLETQFMSWQHLWNYLSVLVIAIETMNLSSASVIQWRKVLDNALQRLHSKYLPSEPMPNLKDNFDYFVNFQMLTMVHRHLGRLLIRPFHSEYLDDEGLANMVLQCQNNSIIMFKLVLEHWDAPIAIVQLLARSYLPLMYLLHTIHDPSHVLCHHLLNHFYTPLHAILPEKEHFFHLGNAATYEVALTFADSGFVADM